ncbi:transposase [Aggregatibacter actinomycetemcomitans]|uniref:Transposase n=1 Tax=Aggregatibacter actinomycetemcomitans TaxID=714 RepID=A0AAC9AI44_AGGAC|nr:transposase [Aggregatibacter actinomycetemcomitans D7S-1]AMQ94416.1 transposase [Aggregatibacter actinomycetemcomitans]EKX97430.1 hypothetical protein HMPREF9996_00933 [Aggregatibacter actinomycetemcomitans Y4]KND83016.1 transposase [Aggregatibacter actinomycetemcomitans serotype a str. H5P1]KOE30820.1 transposase [Aggregatibacter actinomycetemcomitans D17P-3]KOE62099.1 transposase [Aggregatibacter actinomycetemcomitans serotype e str. A160]KOE64300.1 transposase [Aggregatibacter actinomyc
MRKSRLSWHKQSKLIELFVAGMTARTASESVNINKNTSAYYFYRLGGLAFF